ncbi:hypothetical protein NPIL_539931 [Nephila pilipes]|uniref:Uncharacterized protein n=1 Tax=Nephila pilipes TaxID=299642 RepID=A0A8X6PSD5_NEPPI|nr:hypothetical protein NPIL_539931 [Nephila pilipes]
MLLDLPLRFHFRECLPNIERHDVRPEESAKESNMDDHGNGETYLEWRIIAYDEIQDEHEEGGKQTGRHRDQVLAVYIAEFW